MAILAFPKPTFQPAMRIIASITNAFPALVTTTFAHNYATGMICRLNIPLGFGMQEANGKYGEITVTGNTTFTIAIDTSTMDPYAVSAIFPYNYQSGQVTSIAENNNTILYAVRNVLPYSG